MKTTRIGPIIWGTIFLAFSVWIAGQTLFSYNIAPEIWITVIVIALGVLLLTVGLASALRKDKSSVGQAPSSSPSPQPSTSSVDSSAGPVPPASAPPTTF